MTKKITKETLQKWNACEDGYNRFNQLFPKGADLRTASDGLIEDGHPDWSNWLWSNCKGSRDDEYVIQTTATAGNLGTATAGYKGTATAGYKGTATAGNLGTATAGNLGTATAGNLGTATAGNLGTATAGDEGVLIIKYWDKAAQRYRRKVGIVGENGIEPNIPYKLDKSYNFIKVKS